MRLTFTGKLLVFGLLLLGAWLFLRSDEQPVQTYADVHVNNPVTVPEHAVLEVKGIPIEKGDNSGIVIKLPLTEADDIKITYHRPTEPDKELPPSGNTNDCVFQAAGECFTEADLYKAFLYNVDFSLAAEVAEEIVAHHLYGTSNKEDKDAGFYINVRGVEYRYLESDSAGSYYYTREGSTKGTVALGTDSGAVMHHETIHLAQWDQADKITANREMLYHLQNWIDTQAAGQYQLINEFLPCWELCRYEYVNGQYLSDICTTWSGYQAHPDIYGSGMPAHNTTNGSSWNSHVLTYYRKYGLTE